MYTPDQILAMVKSVAEIYQQRQRKQKDKPEYRQNYDKEVRMAMDQKVHALGKFPEKLFDRKIPNETPEQREYRKSSFEPATMPYWNKAVQAVQGRVWNDSNYSITFTDEDVADYFTMNYPQHGSIINWFRSVRLPWKMYDANALQVVMPKSLPMRVTDDGEVVFDDTQEINPEAIMYDCKYVFHHDDMHALILLEEKSKVQYGNSYEKSGMIFLLVDDMNIWRVEQVGRKLDMNFEAYLYYEHGLGYVPAKRLQGVPLEDDGVTYYNSYFYPAVADLNVALFDESTLNMAKIANVFPERWEIMEQCDTCHGEGQIFDDGSYSTCSSCSGTGYNQKPHPLNSIAVKLPDRLDNRPAPPTPPAGYLQKDNDSVRFLREEISRKKQDAFAHINIEVGSRPNGQTATESKIDREELFSFLLTIASEEFKALGWTMDTIGKMRYGIDFMLDEEVMIDAPTDFTIRSYKELTDEIAAANEAGLPSTARKLLLDEYKATRFSNDATVKAIDDLIMKADRLHDLSNEDVLKYNLAGLITKQEAILHTGIHSFITQLIGEQPDFLQLTYDQQVAALMTKVQQVDAAMATGDTDILAQLNA